MEKGSVVSEDSQLVETFGNYLANIVKKKLDIPRENKVKMENNPIINAGKLSEKYPSIIKLNGDMHCNSFHL